MAVLRLIALVCALALGSAASAAPQAAGSGGSAAVTGEPAAAAGGGSSVAGEPAAAAGGDRREPVEPATAPTMRPVGPDVPELPSRLDDGGRVALPPMVIGQDRAAQDRRPMYLGGGLIVLAVVFWWNRRRRDRFEREDAGEPPRARRRVSRDAERDADADDLHAAARGDEPGTPDR